MGDCCGQTHSQSLSTFETRCEVGVHFMSSGPPRPLGGPSRRRVGRCGAAASSACLPAAVKREGAPGSGFSGVRSSSSSPQRGSGGPDGVGMGRAGSLMPPILSCSRSWWAAASNSSGVMSMASCISREAARTNSGSQYLPRPWSRKTCGFKKRKIKLEWSWGPMIKKEADGLFNAYPAN